MSPIEVHLTRCRARTAKVTLLLLGYLCCVSFSPLLQAHDADCERFSFISLSEKTNQKLSEDFHGYVGNNLEPLPRGRQMFASIPFEVGDGMIQLAGKRAPEFPSEVSGVRVEHRCQHLHILQGTGWGSPGVPDGTKIGFYRIHYADGGKEEIPVVYGEDVRDWWQLAEGEGASRATIGWTGMNEASRNFRSQGVQLRLFVRSWENPRPTIPLSSIDFVSLNETRSSPFLIAVTCESSGSEADAIETISKSRGFVEMNDAGHVVSATLSAGRASSELVSLLTCLPQLVELDLSNNRVAEIAVQLPKLKSVEVLTLNFTDATDEVVKEAMEMPSLKTLRLHQTTVTDKSAAYLAESSLEVLDLSGTRITDGAIPHLIRMQKLEELDLRDTRITEMGAKMLKAASPAEIRHH